MDPEKLEELVLRFIQVMKSNDLTEIELEYEGTKIRLKKGGDIVPHPIPYLTQMETAELPAVGASKPAEKAEAKGPKTIEVPSPLVGTFFRAPSPNAPPFVEVGDEVGPDTVLCIVEAMKVMNEIKCEVEGKIVEILVENGQPVEYGQVLFLIEPHGT